MQYIFGSVGQQKEGSVSGMRDIVKKKYQTLKGISGSHSPSAHTLQQAIPEIKLTIDCCYLSNPLATDVFMARLRQQFADDQWVHSAIESYPAQNRQIAQDLSKAIGAPAANIFIGNGATEIIQSILSKFVHGKLLILIPTFSPYHEFVNNQTVIHFYPLNKSADSFELYRDHLLLYTKTNSIQNIVLINPNNPDGSYIENEPLQQLLADLHFMDNIILDESFIDFAGQTESMTRHFSKFPNLTIIKSMSKDFGIAGIRCAYCITKASYVSDLISSGFLWNSNAFAIYFLSLLSDASFVSDYLVAKEKYQKILDDFGSQLMSVNPRIRFYKSKANFFLGEVIDSTCSVEDLMLYLLVDWGIYIRACSDKIGLTDRFFRISCRREEDNKVIIQALQSWK